jgi:hypothetical protein
MTTTTTDAQHAVEFLRWLFGDDPDGYIYILRQRPSSDPAEARQDKYDLNPTAFSRPEKVDSIWWEEQSHLWSQTFSTATIREKKGNNHGNNCVEIPALWCDIDACKKLGFSGEEFYTDLKSVEDVSGWVRSSENGIQGFWKLKEPYQCNGDKEQFADDLAGVLYDIALYYGGDTKVVNLGRLMRLPGSINIKREYTNPVMAKATKLTDIVYSLKALKERFQPDPDIVPRVVAYAVTKALTEIWEEGERHEIILRLAGTVRKNGINKEACKRLVKETQKFFSDGEDRTPDIDTTYDADLGTLASLRTDYVAIAEDVEQAIKFWTGLKVTYCKKRGFDFFPENIDPTQPEDKGNYDFCERHGFETHFTADAATTKFANFVIRLRGRLIKADTNTSVWLADVITQGEPPALVEISTEKHSQWHKFLTIKGMPVGLSIEQPKLWAQYISYLAATCPNVSIRESSYYGWLDVHKKVPTLLMPGTPHPEYQWTGGDDTVCKPGAIEQMIGRDEAIEYLSKFAEYYPTCHEERLIWPALGWFASCAIKGLFWQRFHGFPALVVNGLSQSGKTWLTKEVLAMHYGASTVHSFASSAFSIEKYLIGSNICPLVIDEFRNLDEIKVRRTLEIMRALFDGSLITRGKSGGESLDKNKVETPLCLIGEHQYHDEATVSRSFIITVNRKFLGDLAEKSEEERMQLAEQQQWLMDRRWAGYLGSLLIRWSSNNLDTVYEIIGTGNNDKGLAETLINKTCPSSMPRKRVSCTNKAAGLMMMNELYNSYGLEFPLKKIEMLDALYASDSSLDPKQTYDMQTLKHLFEITDQIIVEGHRAKMSHEGALYIWDIDDNNFIYFDMVRWYRLMRPYVKSSDSAAITDKHGFIALLKDNHTQADSVFVEFLEDHPEFGICVKVNLQKVSELYGVSVQQWRGINGFQDT